MTLRFPDLHAQERAWYNCVRWLKGRPRSYVEVTDELGIDVLGPDDIEGLPAVSTVAKKPASTYRLTVTAGEIKPLVAALSETGRRLVEP
jgi:hypothetical protein